MEDMLHGRYGTCEILNTGDMVHEIYDNWEI